MGVKYLIIRRQKASNRRLNVVSVFIWIQLLRIQLRPPKTCSYQLRAAQDHGDHSHDSLDHVSAEQK